MSGPRYFPIHDVGDPVAAGELAAVFDAARRFDERERGNTHPAPGAAT